MEPEFLTLDEVLKIHRNQIRTYGGTEGVRDLGLLQAALAMPSAGVSKQYLHAGLHEMAAAYLFHLVKNQPFVDGNKRVAAVATNVLSAPQQIAVGCRRRRICRAHTLCHRWYFDETGCCRVFP